MFNDIQFGIRSADINEEVNLLSSEGSGGASDYKKKRLGATDLTLCDTSDSGTVILRVNKGH